MANYNRGGSTIGGIISLVVVAVLLALFIGWGTAWYTDWTFSTISDTLSSWFSSDDDDTTAGTDEDGDSSTSSDGSDSSTSDDEINSGNGSTESTVTAYSITYDLSGVTCTTNYSEIYEDETLTLYFRLDKSSYEVNEVTVTGAAVAYSYIPEPTDGNLQIASEITLIITDATQDVTIKITAGLAVAI